jgi:hypothetical protein
LRSRSKAPLLCSTSSHKKTNTMQFHTRIFALLLLSALTFGACHPDDNNAPLNTPASGQWKVSFFFDKQEETGYYNGYVFEFGSNGSLNISRSGQNWTGTWATGIDDSKNKLEITVNGSHPSELEELEEDWLIIEMTDSFMHFEHLSGGNGDTEVLKFVKN